MPDYPKDGFYRNLSMQDYLSAPGLSKSALVDLALSPAHYKARQFEPRTFTGADLGSAVHMLVLQPEMAEKRIVTPPPIVLAKNGSKNTNAYRDWASGLDASTIVLSVDEWNAAQSMRDAVMSHPVASEVLSGGHAEVSAFYTDQTGVKMKCRPDYLSDTYAVDLKTTVLAHPVVFGSQAYKLKYYWSAYWTLKIIKGLTHGNSRTYVFVAVEKASPWAVKVFETNQAVVDLAREEIAPLVCQYRTCQDLDFWPGYDEDITDLILPKRAFKNREE